MSKELTVSQSSSWQDLKEQATYAFKSGLLPQSIKTPEQAITIAAMGKELGLPIMASLTGIFVVNGLPTIKGQTMLRLIYERVPGAKINFVTPPEKQNSECEVEMQRPGGVVQRFKYTHDDAAKAGLLNKQPWQQHKSVMLRWSAVRIGARVVFPDAISGVYMPDELQDNPKDIPPDPAVAIAAKLIEPSGFASDERNVVDFIPDDKRSQVQSLLKGVAANKPPPVPKPPPRPSESEGPKPMRNAPVPDGWPAPDTNNSSYVIEIGTYKGLTVSEIPISKQAYWAQCSTAAPRLTGEDKEKITRLMDELEKAIKAGAT